MTQDLLAIHQQYHETFLKYEANVQAYYLPGNWVPHCTVAIDLEASGIPEVVAYCRARFQQVTGRFTEIGLVEFQARKRVVYRRTRPGPEATVNAGHHPFR